MIKLETKTLWQEIVDVRIWSYTVSKRGLFLKLAASKNQAKYLKAIYEELRFYCICRLQGKNFIKKQLFHKYFPRL